MNKDGKRSILLNPNATITNRTLQQLEIHELVHDMYNGQDFNKIKEMVLNFDKGKIGYEEARKNLEDLYSQVYDKDSKDFLKLIDEETVADIIGNKLGDEQFVNKLVSQSETRNFARKIYDWVVEKLNKMTRSFENMNDYFFWKDIENKFSNAFRQEYQGKNNETRFSIQKDNNGKKYVQVDIDQNIFKGKDTKEYSKIAKKYILEQYRDGKKAINLPTKEKVVVTGKTANEYTHPKNHLPVNTKTSKMKASTELDNLLEVSEYQYSSKDDGRHNFAKDGWDYYKTIFEVNGERFEGIINIAKSGNKKTLYDITKIKRINQNRSASAEAFSTSLIDSNNSIPQSNENSNTQKYSMQG